MMTTGEKLRQKREEKKLSLEKAAQGTNIRIQFLQAIENDKLDAMASPAQAKGFTRLYASFLGLDPNALFESEISVPDGSNDNEIPLPEHKTPELEETLKEKIKRKVIAKKRDIPENADPRERFKDLIPVVAELTKSSAIFKEIGEELRSQRESLGLTLADVERLTKIREIHLYNLEQGNIDSLPSTVQGRGILNNYSNFLSIEPAKIQDKFAAGLQQKRLETAAVELTSITGKATPTPKSPVTGWRRFLTIDLLVGSSVFVILLVLVIWGAIQVIGSTQSKIEPTIESISDVLINPGSETATATLGLSTEISGLTGEPSQVVNTVSGDLLATINSVNTGSIQLVVVGVQRTYMKVTADGKEVFNGRVIPGSAYTFSGSTKIVLIAGNASGIQVFYNQNDLGVLGMIGEVVSLEFTSKGYVTSTPMFTPSPTATLPPTLTQRPTTTPTVTPTQPTPTITPLINP